MTRMMIENKKASYLSHNINVTMSLYLRSKKSYDDVCASVIVCLTHPNTLKIIKDINIQPCGDPNIYLLLKDEISMLNEELIGHVMMDKIKLKNGVAFNCNNNEVAGFVVGQLNTNMVFENLVSLTKKKNEIQH